MIKGNVQFEVRSSGCKQYRGRDFVTPVCRSAGLPPRVMHSDALAYKPKNHAQASQNTHGHVLPDQAQGGRERRWIAG